jgi:hypothetical protein
MPMGAPMQITGSVPEELAHALRTNRVCGECSYLALAHGQKLMVAQKFVERLVREESWQVKHLASPLNDLGVCGAHTSGAAGENETITGRMHMACDQFRPNKGLVSIGRGGR